jgi:LmbE family N-acetylglucosaminyl deacetylase
VTLPPLDIEEHLRAELAAPDPWRLESNPFEDGRYRVMLEMIQAHGPFENALEIGCAAGAFTERLAPLCASLHVVDVRPEAILRTAQRLGGAGGGLTWEVASVDQPFAEGRTFDLIVAAEVLYFLPDLATLRRTVEGLASRLAPGGVLLFGSAVDAAAQRWGFVAGAETILDMLRDVLEETGLTACRGRDWGEDCRIATFTPRSSTRTKKERATSPPALAAEEHKLVPYEAVREIPARSVLALAPHPDDEVLGCGGALARHAAAGVAVRVAVATDGAFGETGRARGKLAERRRAESRAAASILGYPEPEFWGLPDHGLVYGEPLVQRILDALGDADLVYAPALTEMHPDHRALGMAAVEAVRRRPGVRIALYEVGVPQRPTLLLDISDLAARKREASRAFASQLERQDYDDHIAALNRFRTYTLPAEVTAAEAYAVVSAEELQADPFRLYQPEHQRQRELGFALDPRDLPLVSVVVRSIDRPELDQTLDSLALQTYPNLEVVVVDAAGRHRPLPPVCGRFPMRLVSAGKSLHRSGAANLGVEHARGELVAFLDDDDLYMPDHLARLVDALRSEPGRRAAYAGVRVEGDDGVVDIYDEPLAPGALIAWNRLPINAVVFERALWLDGCRFDEALEVYEDWDFWLQVSRLTRFARAPGISAVYRAHLGRSHLSSTAPWEQFEARRKVWRKWLDHWDAADLEALVQLFREQTADDARKVAQALFEKAELQTRLEQSERHAQALETTLAATRRSTSWRITAPLRFVVERIRRR